MRLDPARMANYQKTMLMKCLLHRGGTLAACLLLAAVSQAQDFEVDGINYDILSPTTCEVVSGIYAEMTDVSISSEVWHDGVTYKVVSIDDYAFADCTRLQRLTIPSRGWRG